MAGFLRLKPSDSRTRLLRALRLSARAVAARDDVIDGLYTQIFRELLSFIVEDPRTTTRALYLLFAAHNLERIGDRAVNIAERVIFMTSGEMKELSAGPDAPL